jgi:hypothetical protein
VWEADQKEFFLPLSAGGWKKKWNPLRLMAWLKQAGSSRDGKLSRDVRRSAQYKNTT